MKLSHVAFRTQHTDETYKFYTEALGLEEHFRLYNGDGSLWIIYLKDKDGQFIELFTGGTNESESEDRRMRSFQHICMLVDDLESEARRLQDMGIDVYLGPTWLGSKYDVPYSSTFVGKCGSTAIYVRDPEGNEVEIMQYLPTSLQTKSKEEIAELEELIRNNDYIPEIKHQGNDMTPEDVAKSDMLYVHPQNA